MTLRLAVVSGGLSEPSSTRLLADRLTAAAVLAGRALGREVVVEHVDLRDHAHALADRLLTGFPSPALRVALDAVTGADAVVLVSPIYNGSYSGLVKTFVDVLEPGALEGTPVLLGATGGTARHSLALDFALRPLMAYLRAAVVPTAVFAASGDWGSSVDGSTDGALADRIRRAGTELVRLAASSVPAALPSGSDAQPTTHPGDDVTPFATLLARGGRAG